MNLEEIRQQFQNRVDSKVEQYVSVINEEMITSYEELKKEKQITITEKTLNGSFRQGWDLPLNMRDAIIRGIRNNFQKDWDIEAKEISYDKSKKLHRALIFTLKGYTPQESTKGTEEGTEQIQDRSEILDL